MREELDDLLYQRYPKIFSERHELTSRSNMAFGICCNDGWFALLAVLCGQMQIWTDQANVPQVTALQSAIEAWKQGQYVRLTLQSALTLTVARDNSLSV